MNGIGQFVRKVTISDRFIILFCTILLILVWSVAFWLCDHDRKASLDMIHKDGDRLAQVVEEYVRQILKTNVNPMGDDDERTYSVSPVLSGVFQQMSLDSENYVVRVIGLDGIVRASSRGTDLGTAMAGSDILSHMKNTTDGFYATIDQTSGKNVEVSYHVLPDHPLVIQVEIAEEALVLLGQRRATYFIAASAVTLFILLSTAYIITRSHKQRRDEAWLHTFISNTPLVFYAMNPTGIFMLSEGLGLKKIGLKAGEAVGRSIYEMYQDYPDILAAFRQALRGEAVFFEHQVGDVYLSNRLLPITDDHGQILAIVGAAVDISERVMAEQRLQDSFKEVTATHNELSNAHIELTATYEELTAVEEELRCQYDELGKLNQDLLSRNAVLEALREVAAKLMSQTELTHLLKTVVAWATTSVGTQHGTIALLNEQENIMDELGGVGIFSNRTGIKLNLDQGLVSQVYRTGQPIAIKNYNTWINRLEHPFMDEVHCFAQVPLKRDDKVIGIIGVASTDDNYCFGERELELLSRFAELAEIAVENIRKIDALHRSQKMVMDIFNAVGDGLIVNDGETGEILAVNKRLQELSGYSEKDFKETGISLISNSANKEAALKVIHATIQDGPQPLYERESQTKDGRQLILEISSTPVEIDGKIRCLASMRDITARKQMKESINYLRQRDPMTDAYNRDYFETEIMRMETNKHRNFGIFVCDVDGLKLINDTLGNHQGDELLKRTAGILGSGVQAPDYVARIGGDEFAVILFDTITERMERLEQYYRRQVKTYNDKNPELPLSLSLGWALRENSMDVKNTLKTADNNMDRQKLHQRQSIRSSIVQTMMKALEARDHITEGHADRLSVFMEKMGQRLSLPTGTISDMWLFAKFHDIGKVGIPDNILNKPGKLTDEEMSIMRQHCEIGFRIAKSSPDLEPIANWVLKHHEYWNGKGYPMGAIGEDIPIPCRILGIVDAYDAMTSDRPYRKALPNEEAITEIRRCSGTQFDPILVEEFIIMLSQ